jgi:membrane protein DedA with SNARE-associated domain
MPSLTIAGFVAAAGETGGTLILSNPSAALNSIRGAVEKVVPLPALAALIVGLLIGYALGRFFGDDLAESRTFNYLSGKRRLRR